MPGDTDDIRKEYEILLHEVGSFNPELMDKQRVLAITKSDLLDEELIEMLSADLPDDLPVVFISAVAQQGITELKDILWAALNSESNKLQAILDDERIVHRNKDLTHLHDEMQEEGEDLAIPVDEDMDIEELEDYEVEDWDE